MSGKEVIPMEAMKDKVAAAVEARSSSEALFLIARTDALEPHGMDEALRRCEAYIKAGADAIYVEGPSDKKQLKQIGESFKNVPKVMDILEGGGETPWFDPDELRELGFSMILYPTTVLFRATYAIQQALKNLYKGKPMDQSQAVKMKEFEKIVDIDFWSKIESRFSRSRDQA